MAKAHFLVTESDDAALPPRTWPLALRTALAGNQGFGLATVRAHPADRRAYVCAVSASTGAAFARTIDGDDVAALLPPRARAAYARAPGNKGLDRDTGLCIVAALKFADGAFSLERCP